MKVSNFAIISRVYRNFKKHLLKPIPTEIKSILSHNPPRSSRLSSSSTSQRRCLRSRTPPARWRRGQRRSYPESEVRSRGIISCMRGDGSGVQTKEEGMDDSNSLAASRTQRWKGECLGDPGSLDISKNLLARQWAVARDKGLDRSTTTSWYQLW